MPGVYLGYTLEDMKQVLEEYNIIAQTLRGGKILVSLQIINR